MSTRTPHGEDEAEGAQSKLLSRVKQELLALRLQRLATGAGAGVRRLGAKEALASYGQRRLWFLQQLSPNDASYHLAVALRLRGPLNVAALEASLNRLLARHVALRVRFEARDGEPWQLVEPATPWRLTCLDLCAQDADARVRELARARHACATEPFSLANGPLVRSQLVRLNEDTHELLLGLHHVVADAWSEAILTRELRSLYSAAVRGTAAMLPSLPVDYLDYAQWERQWVLTPAGTKSAAYWRNQLAGELPRLDLGTRSRARERRGATERRTLAPALCTELVRLGQSAGATPFMTALAGWAALLWRATGQAEALIGTPVSNRSRREFEPLVGFLLNTLVLRLHEQQGMNFRDVLAHVRAVTLEAFRHREYPFDALVEQIAPARAGVGQPLFEVMFVFQDEAPAATWPSLDVTAEEIDTGTATFDLVLLITQTSEGWTASLIYDVDRFDPHGMADLLQRYEALLAAAVAQPEASLHALSIVAPDEHQVATSPDPSSDSPPAMSVLQRFERVVQQHPDAWALFEEGRRLTYRDVQRRVERWAAALHARGVGPNKVCAVHLPHDAAAVLVTLAIVRTGAAYLAVDVNQPSAYVRFGLLEAGCDFVLSVGGGALAGPWTSLDFDEVRAETDGLELLPRDPPAPADPFYLVLTSGSSGTPKCVVQTHACLNNLIAWQIESSAATTGTRTLQSTSLAFDVSFQEIWGTWCTGGELVVVGPSARRDPERLLEQLQTERIDRLFVPFVVLQQVAVAARERDCVPPLREVITGGEVLRITSAVRWLFERMPGCELHNHYGPAECHAVTSHVLRGDVTAWPHLPPIGRAIRATSIHILDQNMVPVPRGWAGELYVAGVGVGGGYRRRPAETAERFLPDVFSGIPGNRTYRTGDLARRNQDGDLEFLGRIDQQLKIRGFRVEPAEIEQQVERLPAVRSCLVRLVHDERGDSLVAYVETAPQASLAAADVRQALRGALPDYMIPSAVVVLDRFPLTPTGKVDVRNLPVPAPTDCSVPVEEAAWTEEQKLMGTLLAGVLGVEAIGLEQDFFQSGGNSLLAVQAVGRIRTVFGVALGVDEFFCTPTIAGLLDQLHARPSKGAQCTVPPLEQAGEGGVRASPAQQRLWFTERLQPESRAYLMPVLLRVRGTLELGVLTRALEMLATRHDSLRTRLVEVSGELMLDVDQRPDVSFRFVDVRPVAARDRWGEAQRHAQSALHERMSLAGDALFRVTLIQLEGDDHVLVLQQHHAISDASSLAILLDDFAAIYAALNADTAPDLRPLPLDHRDYAAWQESCRLAGAWNEDLAYWDRHLADHVRPKLPTDFPRPAIPSGRGAAVPVELSPELTAALGACCRNEGVTMFMLLLGVFRLLIHRYDRSERALVGTSLDVRDREPLQGVTGLFVNLAALLVPVRPGDSFRQVLAQVRQVTMDARAHQLAPFERVVERVTGTRESAEDLLCPASFVLIGQRFGSWSSIGLELEPLDLEHTSAKADLTMVMEDRPDRLTGVLEYSTDVFRANTVEWLGSAFTAIAEAVAADAAQSVEQLVALTRREHEAVRCAWSGSIAARTTSDEEVLPRIIDAHAAATPDATAVVGAVRTYSYLDLVTSARRVAADLRAEGVPTGSIVVLVVEDVATAVVAMLGVWNAGCAYAVLSVDEPAERLAMMLAELQPSAALVESALLGRLGLGSTPVVLLDRDHPGQGEPLTDQPPPTPSDVAYVIHTSGSSGAPRGVAIPHAALSSLVRHADYVGLEPQDRMAQTASLSFDGSVFELWGPLGRGAALVPLRAEVLLTPSMLDDELERLDITVLFLTTALCQLVIRECPAALERVRLLLFGGEACDPHSIAELMGGRPPARVVHLYGPTEATVYATSFEVPCELDAGAIPIGKAIPDTTTYVLDEALNLVPPGSIGELFLGGPRLAYGYLGQPQLTAASFLPNPFDGAGTRMYRTGDLVRRRLDGELEFVGRRDQQHKVRGYRIELSEVEQAIRRCHDVAEAIVDVEELPGGDRRLVGFVVAHPGATLTAQDLRSALQEYLPHYAIPPLFRTIDRVPLTPNGKVDRQGLWQGASVPLEAPPGGHAPASEVERQIAEIWTEVLGIDVVTVSDNFFAVGGDSILAIQIVARLQALGLSCTIAQLFRHQTIVELATAIQGGALPTTTAPTDDQAAEEDYPLSRLQAGMIFHSSVARSAAYHEVYAYELRGVEATDTLRAALDAVVARHPVLRTTFQLDADAPYQRVHRSGEMPSVLEVVDLTQLPESLRRQEIRDYLEHEKRRPYAWGRLPLFRVRLFECRTKLCEIVFSFPHALLDGWSFALLLAELLDRYRARVAGAPAQSPPFRSSYRRFVAAEGDAVGDPRARRFWHDYLSDAAFASVPQLLAPAPATDQSETSGTTEPTTPAARWTVHQVPTRLLHALEHRAKQWRLPLKSVLLAAYMRAICVITNETDVTTGVVSHARLEEIDGDRVLGVFLNTLPLRVDARAPTWEDLARAAHRAEEQTMPHRRYPLAELHKAFGRPLFETAFNFLDFHTLSAAVREDHGLSIKETFSWTETNFTLAVTFAKTTDRTGMDMLLESSGETIDPDQARRYADLFLCALGQLAADDDSRPLAWPTPLGEREREAILRAATGESRSLDEALVPHVISRQASRTPDAPAVVDDEGQVLSFGELDRRANQLAHRLLERGASIETPVGILLERSAELPVAYLAVLKAGAMLVPFDQDTPPTRIAMLGDRAGVQVWIARLAANAPGPAIDPADPDLRACPSSAPDIAIAPRAAAYLLHTSGSAGLPKAVVGTHEGLLNRLSWMQETFGLDSDDVVLMKTSVGFDVSLWELLWPLMTGACLFMARPGGGRDPGYLHDAIVARGVTTAHFAPSALTHFLAVAPPAGGCSRLRRVIASGEALSVADARAFATRFDAELANLYGPTEAAIDVSYERHAEAQTTGPIAIGRPIWNTTLYVLDPDMSLVPIGTPGELHIGGVGLARGYAGDPRLTAERFVPDPFSTTAGRRLYRTGDLARALPDGRIEFLGRLDRQLKIAGQRVEPGEIEHHVLELLGDGHVLVTGTGGSAPRLVAYVVNPGGVPLHDLRTRLRDRLPERFVPAAFVELPELPLLVNGKLDHARLPAPRFLPEAHAGPHHPLSATEQLVAAVWSQALGAPITNAATDFFEAGGDSLRAMQAAAGMGRLTGFAVPVRLLFEERTVRRVARALSQRLKPEPRPVPVSRDLGDVARPLSPSELRLWGLHQFLRRKDVFHIPQAVRLTGDLDLEHLQRSLQLVIERHDALRTAYVVKDDSLSASTTTATAVAIVDDLRTLPDEESNLATARILRQHREEPFDLTRPPLVRFRLLRLGDRDHILAIAAHHICMDGWSMGVLLRDWAELYDALVSGREPRVTALPHGYAQYLEGRRHWMRGPESTWQWDYWRERLANAVPRLPLFESTQAPDALARLDTAPIAFDHAMVKALQALSQRTAITPFVVLVGALSVALHALTQARAIRIGTLSANRSTPGSEDLVGLLVNTVLLDIDVHPESTLVELLANVRRALLEASAHQELPFESLAAEQGQDPATPGSAHFDVLFVHNNAAPGLPSITGIETSEADPSYASWDTETVPTTFAVILMLTEDDTEIRGLMRFNPEVCDASMADKLAATFGALVPDLVVRMERTVADIVR